MDCAVRSERVRGCQVEADPARQNRALAMTISNNGRVHASKNYFRNYLRYTTPPFITKLTCVTALMSFVGSPGTATTSAK